MKLSCILFVCGTGAWFTTAANGQLPPPVALPPPIALPEPYAEVVLIQNDVHLTQNPPWYALAGRGLFQAENPLLHDHTLTAQSYVQVWAPAATGQTAVITYSDSGLIDCTLEPGEGLGWEIETDGTLTDAMGGYAFYAFVVWEAGGPAFVDSELTSFQLPIP